MENFPSCFENLIQRLEGVEELWKVLSTNLRLRFSRFCITEPLWVGTCGRLFRRRFSIKSSVFQRNLCSISRIVLHLASTKPESWSLNVKYTFLGRFLCFNCNLIGIQRDSRCKIVVSSTAIFATLISSQILIESHNRQSRIRLFIV